MEDQDASQALHHAHQKAAILTQADEASTVAALARPRPLQVMQQAVPMLTSRWSQASTTRTSSPFARSWPCWVTRWRLRSATFASCLTNRLCRSAFSKCGYRRACCRLHRPRARSPRMPEAAAMADAAARARAGSLSGWGCRQSRRLAGVDGCICRATSCHDDPGAPSLGAISCPVTGSLRWLRCQ